MNVLIFSQPVRSGKTSGLQRWSRKRGGVAGILMPDRDGKRYFESLPSGLQWPIDSGTGESWEVGSFRISKEALHRAAESILSARAADWLIIDEVGKLELHDEGFAPVLSTLLKTPNDRPANLLLVVRASLLQEVIRHFGLQHARILHSLDEI